MLTWMQFLDWARAFILDHMLGRIHSPRANTHVDVYEAAEVGFKKLLDEHPEIIVIRPRNLWKFDTPKRLRTIQARGLLVFYRKNRHLFATCKAVSDKIAYNNLAEDEDYSICYETFRSNSTDTTSLDSDSKMIWLPPKASCHDAGIC